MSKIIKIRDLKKGDVFYYENRKYKAYEVDKCFKAISVDDENDTEIIGVSADFSKIEVELIQLANEDN